MQTLDHSQVAENTGETKDTARCDPVK
jgi:hypothetical protein